MSQLLLTRFWPNFKGRFLGPSLTDSNCHSDICPGNICPGDICPYQEYLNCYWSDFDQTLKVGFWNHFLLIPTVTVTFVQATFVLETFVHIRDISAVTDPILNKLFWPNYFRALIFWPNILLRPNFFGHNNFLVQNFFGNICP